MTPAAGELDLDRAYREHGHVVLRRARRILGDDDEANEALQEIFLSLTRRPEQFSGHSSLTTCLYRVTTNLCLNRLRNRRRRDTLLEHNFTGAPAEQAPAAESVVDAQRILAALPEKLATVAVHYYIDEMTHDEIATMLGCSRRMVEEVAS